MHAVNVELSGKPMAILDFNRWLLICVTKSPKIFGIRPYNRVGAKVNERSS